MTSSLISRQPPVSVLVTTYNAAQYLAELCRSILAQTYSNFEVLILDNGSTDETRSVLTAFEKDPRFKVFAWEKNRGFTPAFLELLSRANGDYWVCPGADDVLQPGFLEQRQALMQAHPEIAVVCGGAQLIDESGRPIAGTSPPLTLPPQIAGVRGMEILLQHNVINFPSALVRIDVTRRVLPYFMADWQHGPDWHLWILLLAGGHTVLQDERSAFGYRIHRQSLSGDPRLEAIRRAECRLVPLCTLYTAAAFSPMAADYLSRWRKTLYHLWLLRALKMRYQGVLQDKWLQMGGLAYYGVNHRPVSLFPEYLKHAPGVALAAFTERRSLRKQSFRVSGLAEIDDPVFR
jgi:glycosyltransferase involved in cell wall biosynthesis